MTMQEYHDKVIHLRRVNSALLDACLRTRNYLLCSKDGNSHCVEVLEDAIAITKPRKE